MLEASEILRPANDGVILERTGRIDVFNCLRRLDEQSFAGGVFIVDECTDAETWQVLKEKGIPVSRAGGHALLYNPSHLLGVEAPISVLSACLLGYGTSSPNVEYKVDLLARADRNWSTGEILTITDHHHTRWPVSNLCSCPLRLYRRAHHCLILWRQAASWFRTLRKVR